MGHAGSQCGQRGFYLHHDNLRPFLCTGEPDHTKAGAELQDTPSIEAPLGIYFRRELVVDESSHQHARIPD